MGKSVQEINYEEALKVKAEAQKLYSEAQKELGEAKVRVETNVGRVKRYGYINCGGFTFYFDKNARSSEDFNSQVTSFPFGCAAYYKGWKETAEHKAGVQVSTDLGSAESQLSSAIANEQQAKINYDNSVQAANAAYQDWIEWKKANMTAEELADFQELEDKAKGTALRMDAWKWAGIIGGVLVFGFGAWYLWKRIKG